MAANQLIVAGTIELLGEAIVFLEAYGVDTDAALTVLGGGLADSTVIARKGAAMLARVISPVSGSPCTTRTWASSPVRRGRSASRSRWAVVAQLAGSLNSQGDGGLDHSALLKLVKQLSGLVTEAV